MSRPLLQIGPFQIGLRHLYFVAGLGLLPPVVLLVALAFFTPITTSGLCYTLAVVVITAGLLVASWRTTIGAWLLAVGGTALVATATVRVYVGGDGTTARLITLPDGGSTRWVNRLIHEQDLSLFGARVAALTGVALSRDEAAGLTEALTAAYASLESAGGTTASPAPATYLMLQSPNQFDAVVIEPPGTAAPQASLIYLHGFTGSFSIQAWLASQPAARLGMLTVAPSVGFVGNWWTPRSEETLRRTIAYLHRRGIRRIYVAGLSNGAVGISRIAPNFRHDLAGVILISGADPYTSDPQLPVLVLHGALDERMHIEAAREYQRRFGDRTTLREFADGDHLMLAKQAARVQAAMETWLREQEAATK